MIDVIEITFEEFKDSIYKEYVELFPIEERRELTRIKSTYDRGIEKIYKIVHDNILIGFFMLERIDDSYPFYLDYFAIFKEFQNKGYGTKALEKLIKKIIIDKEICGEIEKVDLKDAIKLKRFEFYKKLGFEKIDSEYLLFDVIYMPIIRSKSKNIDKDKMDKIFFDYYKINSGEKRAKKNCRIIK